MDNGNVDLGGQSYNFPLGDRYIGLDFPTKTEVSLCPGRFPTKTEVSDCRGASLPSYRGAPLEILLKILT